MINKLSPAQSTLLDFVRGAAAIIVLSGHVFSRAQGDMSFGKTMPWQSFGVVIFFWMSGFLIAYHCLVKSAYSFREYMIDRFSRIYVIYIPVLAVFAIALVTTGLVPPPSLSEVVANLFMLQHTPFTRIFNGLPTYAPLAQISPLWTIAIEWWLYTLFGIVYFFHRSSLASRLAMVFLLVPSCLVVGYFALKEYVALMWFLGAMCAALFVKMGKISPKAIGALACIGMSGFLVRLDILSQTAMNMYDIQLGVFTVITIFCLLISFSQLRIHSWITSACVYLAFISYALYLSHEPVRRLLVQKYFNISAPTISQAAMICIGCIIVASVIAYFLENQHLVLRKWLKSSTRNNSVAQHVSVCE